MPSDENFIVTDPDSGLCHVLQKKLIAENVINL